MTKVTSDGAIYARYAVWLVVGVLVSGGNMPQWMALDLLQDDQFMSVMAGVLLGAANLAWYHLSESRRALREWLGR